jgi:hypothetical protein
MAVGSHLRSRELRFPCVVPLPRVRGKGRLEGRLSFLTLAIILAAGCSVSIPDVGDGSITCNSDHDCQPGEICDLTDSPHYCFAAPADGGDAGPYAGDAGDAGGKVDAGDAGDAGNADAGMDAGCLIAGQAYAAGDPNPAFACAICAPAKSTSDWSLATDGTACGNDGGNYCFAGVCVLGCLIDGGVVYAGENPPGNGCQVCDPDAGSAGYTNVPELSACADAGNFCHLGQCAYGCGIGDAGFVPGWTPENAVVSACCNPIVNARGWTPAFAIAREVTLTAHPSGLTVNDFNGDGMSDFAVTQIDNTVDAYVSLGGGGFSLSAVMDSAAGPGAIVSAVFASNGPVDLAALDEAGPALELYSGDDAGSFSDAGAVTLPLTNLNAALSVPLLGLPDLIVSGSLSSAPGIDVFENQDGAFGIGHSSFVFTLGTSPWALASGMFRFDAGSDIAVMNNDGSGVDVLVNNGGTLKESQLAPSVGMPQGIVTAELNGDGLQDFVVLSTQLGDAGVAQSYFSLGDGGFALGPTTLIDPKPVALASFMRAGAASSTLAVADGKNGSVGLLAAIDGGLSPAGTYAAGTSANAISTGDFNGDGLTDLVVSDPGSSVYILYGQCR